MYKQAADYIKKRTQVVPNIGIILGSGLGEFGDIIEKSVYIDYINIPGFPTTTVSGHLGRFVIGQCHGKNIIAMQGRFHYYEGNTMDKVVMPVRVMKMLGVDTLICTNAAGGINPGFEPGDFMTITDHINITGINPLRGKNMDEFGPRFPDMTYAYDRENMSVLMKSAADVGLQLHKGIYAMMSGPSYETPAEIRMLRTLGADAVGMSTVPEVITAVHAGIKVTGISCITNMAAGVLDQPLNHLEVIDIANKSKEKFKTLLSSFIGRL